MIFKKFLTRLILFIIPVVICITVFEVLLREIPNDYSLKNRYLQQHAEEVELLILGNSHMYRGLIAEEINLKSFNAAYLSQTANLDFLIFEHYKNDFVNLKYLVVGVSYHSLYATLETSVESWRLKNYNLYYPFNITLTPKNYSEFLSNTFAVNLRKIKSYYIEKINSVTTTKLGSGAINRLDDIEKTGLTAAKRHAVKNDQDYKRHLSYYANIINYCKAKNIKVIFLTSPAYSSYTRNLDSRQLSQMNHLMDSLCKTDQNVIYLNLLKDRQFTKNDFINADHLNIKGAQKLTKKLNFKMDSLQKSVN